jgi:flavin reductase (DIM6/NTAB) family NADH-FMN oxidoreductase RutF
LSESFDDGLATPLWKSLTSTVGLLVTRNRGTQNVMAAEWTYFVAKAPPHVAVVLSSGTLSQGLIGSGDPFTVTLCSAGQADLADFAGSFSGRDVDKTAAAAMTLRPGLRADVPWIDGGVLAMECVQTRRVDFPGYHMIVGEVVQAHWPEQPLSPLVKHDGMFALGEPLPHPAVVAAGQWVRPGASLRVAATGRAPAGTPYGVVLHGPEDERHDLGRFPPNRYGDLLLTVPTPPVEATAGWTVVVSRRGLADGAGAVTGPVTLTAEAGQPA